MPEAPDAAYAIPSLISLPAPANAGAVPKTATFPLTAAPHVAAVDSASAGAVVAQLAADGSPRMITVYAANCAVVIASHVVGVATVTDNPNADADAASALDDPPVTDVDKISADPDTAALAGVFVDTIDAAVTAAAPTATTPAAGTRPDAASDPDATTAVTRRARRHPRRTAAARRRRP